MIKIEAVVRPERVNLVVEALLDAGVGGYHISNVSGKGTQQGVEV
ncbi:MAG: P-II family nitrogen regulator, partial [Chloroflexi bacterium]|nr:P-II family nitrogen regulator [Chloroflexota bacterium]